MKRHILCLMLLACAGAAWAVSDEDSTDVFYRHLDLNEVTVTGVTGIAHKLKNATSPVSVVTNKELNQTSSTNIIDAISHLPGMAGVTTGGAIAKPVIRGLGYNRIVTVADGVRQEGQQWGDEHGIEVDAEGVGSVEILKGPASLMYGSDAMAGVVILKPVPTLAEGEMKADVASQYQTNNGLWGYSLSMDGNKGGVVWQARWSEQQAHAYKNRYDGYVPGSQFAQRAAQGMVGVNRTWGHSRQSLDMFHLTPSIVEGERDESTGRLLSLDSKVKSYGKLLPFQQVRHWKAVWDNSVYLNDGVSLKAVTGYQCNDRQEFEESADDYELFFRLHTLTYDVRCIFDDVAGWKFNAGLGGMWQRSQNKGEEVLIPAYRLLDVGGYVTTSRTTGAWTWSGGLRMDTRRLHSYALEEDGAMRFNDFSRSFSGLTGSLGAVCAVSNALNVRLNVARGMRAPNMSELGSNGVHEGTVRYELGNSALNAEHSWQADLGVDFSSRYVSAWVALFANRIDNYIFARRVPQTIEEGMRTYQYSSGDARLLGFEASVDVHPLHCLHIGNSFSMVDARQMHQPKESRYLPFTPAPRWNCDVKVEIMHHARRFFNNAYVSLGTELYMRQNHFYALDDTETATPSCLLVNMSAGTDLVWHGRKVAELFAAVTNLTDRAWQNHLSRLKYTDVNPVTGRQGIFNMGRNVTFKLRIPIDL